MQQWQQLVIEIQFVQVVKKEKGAYKFSKSILKMLGTKGEFLQSEPGSFRLEGLFLIKVSHQRTGMACFQTLVITRSTYSSGRTNRSCRTQLTLCNRPSSCLSVSESRGRGRWRYHHVAELQGNTPGTWPLDIATVVCCNALEITSNNCCIWLKLT